MENISILGVPYILTGYCMQDTCALLARRIYQYWVFHISWQDIACRIHVHCLHGEYINTGCPIYHGRILHAGYMCTACMENISILGVPYIMAGYCMQDTCALLAWRIYQYWVFHISWQDIACN